MLIATDYPLLVIVLTIAFFVAWVLWFGFLLNVLGKGKDS